MRLEWQASKPLRPQRKLTCSSRIAHQLPAIRASGTQLHLDSQAELDILSAIGTFHQLRILFAGERCTGAVSVRLMPASTLRARVSRVFPLALASAQHPYPANL